MDRNSSETPSSIVGVEQASGRRRCSPFLVVVALAMATRSHAQERELKTYRATEPEGRLLAYYAAAMTFSSLGAAGAVERWFAGLEATWIPRLTESQRRAGIEKPEATNLSPVLPRPRLAARLPRGVVLEASWIPPVRVVDGTANVVSVAVSKTVATWRGVSLAPRLSAVGGRVRGSITCNRDAMEGRGADLALYFAAVCHGNDSDDWFEPRLVAGELVAWRALRLLRSQLYAAAGARVDRTRFDIGVKKNDGTRDSDHPILELRDTRMHFAVGGKWCLRGRFTSAAEWFYAPGSVSTVRLLAGITGGR